MGTSLRAARELYLADISHRVGEAAMDALRVEAGRRQDCSRTLSNIDCTTQGELHRSRSAARGLGARSMMQSALHGSSSEGLISNPVSGAPLASFGCRKTYP